MKNLIIIIFSFLLSEIIFSQHITNNVYKRTFLLKYKSNFGTAFTTEVDNKQYLITAKHIFTENEEINSIEIFHENKWKSLSVRAITCEDSLYDVIALAPKQKISVTYPLPIKSDDLTLTQEVFFLGFPYLMYTDDKGINSDFPLAFVKKAIVSSIDKDLIFLDGYNNPGFSGGPVVYWDKAKKQFNIISVIASYRYAKDTVYYLDKSKIEVSTEMYTKGNTGIILSFMLNKIIEAIKNNPIGFLVD